MGLPFLQLTSPPEDDVRLQNAGTLNFTVDSGADRCIVVRAGGEGDNSPGPWELRNVVFAGQSLTRIGGITNNQWSWVDAWYLLAPPVGLDTLSWDVYRGSPGTQTSDGHTVHIECYNDVDQTTPIRGFDSEENATGDTSTLAVPSPQSHELLLDVVTRDGGGQSLTPGTNQTEDFQNAPAGCDVAGSHQDGADDVNGEMDYTFSSGLFSYVIFALVGTSAAPPGPAVDDRAYTFPKPKLRRTRVTA